MSNFYSNKLEKVKIVGANAYIFNELYKANFIKSKTFQYANYYSDILNKIMHIIKSKINKTILNTELSNYFSSVTFSRKCISVRKTYIDNGCTSEILNGWMIYLAKSNNLLDNIYMNYSSYDRCIHITLENPFTPSNGIRKETLDKLINTTLFVHTLFLESEYILNHIRDILTANNNIDNTNYSLLDLHLYLTSLLNSSGYNSDILECPILKTFMKFVDNYIGSNEIKDILIGINVSPELKKYMYYLNGYRFISSFINGSNAENLLLKNSIRDFIVAIRNNENIDDEILNTNIGIELERLANVE